MHLPQGAQLATCTAACDLPFRLQPALQPAAHKHPTCNPTHPACNNPVHPACRLRSLTLVLAPTPNPSPPRSSSSASATAICSTTCTTGAARRSSRATWVWSSSDRARRRRARVELMSGVVACRRLRQREGGPASWDSSWIQEAPKQTRVAREWQGRLPFPVSERGPRGDSAFRTYEVWQWQERGRGDGHKIKLVAGAVLSFLRARVLLCKAVILSLVYRALLISISCISRSSAKKGSKIVSQQAALPPYCVCVLYIQSTQIALTRR